MDVLFFTQLDFLFYSDGILIICVCHGAYCYIALDYVGVEKGHVICRIWI